jgi:hypothetical protein
MIVTSATKITSRFLWKSKSLSIKQLSIIKYCIDIIDWIANSKVQYL